MKKYLSSVCFAMGYFLWLVLQKNNHNFPSQNPGLLLAGLPGFENKNKQRGITSAIIFLMKK